MKSTLSSFSFQSFSLKTEQNNKSDEAATLTFTYWADDLISKVANTSKTGYVHI